MNPLTAEQQLSGQFLLVWQRLKWWLLVGAAAGALGFAYLVQHKAASASASAHYSLTEQRVSLLAADYQALAPQSQLFIGALEVDELARLVLQLDSPALWAALLTSASWCQAAPSYCATDTQQVASLSKQLKPRLHFEQKRRGNLLSVRWRDADPAQAALYLQHVIAALAGLDQMQRLASLTAGQQQIQQAMEAATSVGERSVLAAKLDQINAKRHLWQQGYYQPFKLVGEVVQRPASKPAPWFAGLIGAFAGVLLLLTAGLLLLRR